MLGPSDCPVGPLVENLWDVDEFESENVMEFGIPTALVEGAEGVLPNALSLPVTG